jgi:hypothetical protein
MSHLNMISDIHFNGNPLNELISDYDIHGKKINKFVQFVEESWMTSKTSNK